MWFLLFLLTYNDNGHTYDSESKKTLIKVKQGTTEFVVDASVEIIQAGNVGSSAFSLCSKSIVNVSFQLNSKCKALGLYLFSTTSIQNVDFTNCLLLESIPEACFKSCSQLNLVQI